MIKEQPTTLTQSPLIKCVLLMLINFIKKAFVMQFDNFMPFLTKPQQRDKKHCDTRSAAAAEYDAFYEDSRTM